MFHYGYGIVKSGLVSFLEAYDEEVDLPVYTISPEEIFKGKIGFFDVNFFNDETPYQTQIYNTEVIQRIYKKPEVFEDFDYMANRIDGTDGGRQDDSFMGRVWSMNNSGTKYSYEDIVSKTNEKLSRRGEWITGDININTVQEIIDKRNKNNKLVCV